MPSLSGDFKHQKGIIQFLPLVVLAVLVGGLILGSKLVKDNVSFFNKAAIDTLICQSGLVCDRYNNYTGSFECLDANSGDLLHCCPSGFIAIDGICTRLNTPVPTPSRTPSPTPVRTTSPIPSRTPTSTPTSIPGWGVCGSCSSCGGPQSQCIRNPQGVCLWDPTGCTGGNNSTPVPQAHNPIGYLDGANCTANSIFGWSADRDDTNAYVDIHFYFDNPAGQGAVYIPTPANRANRSGEQGICNVIGGTNCNHRYQVTIPNSVRNTFTNQTINLRDGRSHTVWAYGINISGTPGGAPYTALVGSPKSFVCANW